MKFLIFRNHTVEPFFAGLPARFNGYGDLTAQAEKEETMVWFFMPPPTASQTVLANEIDSYFSQLKIVLAQNPANRCVVFKLSTRLIDSWSIRERNVFKAINEFNEQVEQLSAQNKAVQFIEIDAFFNDFANSELFDWKFYLTAQTALNPKLARPFKNWFKQQLNALNGQRKKCLVLDCDNTLWGGVVGEDGPQGIQIGGSYPGNAFQFFQQKLKEAAENGVILAICSKNNAADVDEVFQQNPFMVLQKNDLAAERVNWQNKAQNIQELADELNIGLDSLVFIDDNPTEREIVRQNLPEVVVPEFPAQPHELPAFFQKIWVEHFQIWSLTDEDRQKTGQYLQNAARRKASHQFVSTEDFLASLEMQLDVQAADSFNLERIAQMTQKTNQFNLTTRRYSSQEIKHFIENGSLVYCLGVCDKFGDNGITVAAIIHLNGEKAIIDSYLLSCRILGRGIEKVFIYYLINLLFDKGIVSVKAEFIPTKKNQQTENFYENIGFELVEIKADQRKLYRLKLDQKLEIPTYFKFIENEYAATSH